MTVKELLERFDKFITNDFNHLRDKVDSQYKITMRLFIGLVLGLLGISSGLVILILRLFGKI